MDRSALTQKIRTRILESSDGEAVDNAARQDADKLDRAIGKLITAVVLGVGEARTASAIEQMDTGVLTDHVITALQGKNFEVSFGAR